MNKSLMYLQATDTKSVKRLQLTELTKTTSYTKDT